MNKLAALVPMRHHSARVPGKNLRPLAGKPLFQHILGTLQAVPEISEIVVDTDSVPILEGIHQNFPKVRTLIRPEHLRADDVPMNEILMYDTSQVSSEFYLQTHSTNPLLKPATISQAVGSFFNNYPTRDSLFSVTRLLTRLYDKDGLAINHNPRELIQTQYLPPVFEENSCIYIFTRKNLVEKRHRISDLAMMFEIDSEEAWDIDEELDFDICDFLLKRQVQHNSFQEYNGSTGGRK